MSVTPLSRRTALCLLLFAHASLALAEETKPDKDGWKLLFDGEGLGGWKPAGFAGAGEAKVDKAFKGGPVIVVGAGERLSGLTWTKDAPKTNYEIALEAMKIQGNDFMCALTFPVGESHATLVLGGWGGTVTGISSIDNSDASENGTTQYVEYKKDQWYQVKVRVTPKKIAAWLGEKQIIDQDIEGRKVSLRAGDISRCVPIGLATYQTSAAYRNIRLRSLPASE